MGLQNADEFREAKDVKEFYQLGLRCAQLTYNAQNLLGRGSTERVDGGVTDYGVEIIKAMNEVGMLIDVSHSGDRTTLDAIELSPKPIAITHSNCRALNNHPRLKTDEAIKKLAAKGGVMGITGVRMFVKDKEPTTIEDIVDHIDHVVKLVGIEHVGIGSDSDLMGYDDMPADQYKQLRAAYKASYAFRDKHRHRRLRPSAEGLRPDRRADPARLQRRQHRSRARRQFPPPARQHVGQNPPSEAGNASHDEAQEEDCCRDTSRSCSPQPYRLRAWAQQTTPDTDDTQALGTIIVTAEKRSEDIQEVPMSISVINVDDLEKLHATQLTDFAGYVPGFIVQDGGAPGQATLALRGITPLSAGSTVGDLHR